MTDPQLPSPPPSEEPLTGLEPLRPGSPFIDAIKLVDEVFTASPVLQRLGYSTHRRKLCGETVLRDPGCCFTLRTGPNREFVISFSYRSDGNHYFIHEVFNTKKEASFLLEDWPGLAPNQPSPGALRAYVGTVRERLIGYVSFLERLLCADEIASVLRGESWLDIPFDWGNLK
jgi:hypothetical protein